MQNDTVMPEVSPTYLWEVPGKPVSVQVDLPMIGRLDWKVIQAARPGGGGMEIGGLLLGTVKRGTGFLVTVEDFEPVGCSYGYGPLYQLTGQDQERFARVLAERNTADGREVVGFFRSHTRAGLSLDAGDLEFCTSHFGKPHQVVLLVRPAEGKAGTAGFFFWEGGSMRAEASHLEFPFSQEVLQASAKSADGRPKSVETSLDAADKNVRGTRLTAAVGRCCIRIQLRPSTVSAEAAR